jgi:hypothetical protein
VGTNHEQPKITEKQIFDAALQNHDKGQATTRAKMRIMAAKMAA